MKKSIYILVSLAFILLSATSCQEAIDLELDTAEPRLVIDAGIAWEKGTDGTLQSIKLSTTTDYYATEIPPVSDANVLITDSEGNEFQFIEDPGTGEYICTDFIPELQETYVLEVTIDGQTYTASEQLVAAPEITRIEQNNEGGFFGEDIEVRFYYEDDGTEENFYLSGFDTDFLLTPEYYPINDDFSQGNEMFEVFVDEDLEHGDEINMSISGISKQFYNYMSLLLESTSGNPFSTPPANVRGNIINQTDEKNYALGFFRLSQVDSVVYEVE